MWSDRSAAFGQGSDDGAVDRAPAPPDRRIRVVPSRWWRPAFVVMVVVAVGVLALGLAVRRGEVLVMPLLLGGNAWQTWRLTHATVDLDGSGMTVRRFRRRRLEWSDVRALRLDPRGGPRLLRAELARGDLVELPLLDEEGTEAVLAAHAAARDLR